MLGGILVFHLIKAMIEDEIIGEMTEGVLGRIDRGFFPESRLSGSPIVRGDCK